MPSKRPPHQVPEPSWLDETACTNPDGALALDGDMVAAWLHFNRQQHKHETLQMRDEDG